MTAPPFSRFWGDPAQHLDEWRHLQRQLAKAEQEQRERDLKRKRRRIRKLLKQAKARQLKGQT